MQGTSSSASRSNKACRNCSVAKVKCLPSAENAAGSRCERCHRLNKDCQEQSAVVRKRRTVKPTYVSSRKSKRDMICCICQVLRVTQLEQKVDSLVTLLTSAQRDLANGTSFPPGSDGPVTQSTTATLHANAAVLDQVTHHPAGTDLSVSSDPHGWSQLRTGRKQRAIPEHNSINYEEELYCTYEEAESLLLRFETQLIRNLPFFATPRSTTVEALFRQRPFLLKTILMAVSYDNHARRSKLRTAVTEALSQQLLFQGARSLDLLQGILIMVVWPHTHWMKNSQTVYFLQLAVALLGELTLDRKSITLNAVKSTAEDAYAVIAGFQGLSERTVEERRTLLGCYLITVIISTSFKKGATIPWSPYLDDCCEEVLRVSECPGDQWLVYSVRLQQLVDKTKHSLSTDASTATLQQTAALIGLYEGQLKQFHDLLPSELKQDVSLNLQYHSAVICLHEIALHDLTSRSRQGETLQRNEMLVACLLATQAFFDILFTIPIPQYPYEPCTTFAEIGHVSMVACRLCRPHVPGWDADHARKVLGMPDLLETLATQFQKAAAFTDSMGSEIPDEKVFEGYAREIRWVKGWFEGRLAASASHVGNTPAPQTASSMTNSWDQLEDLLFDNWDGTFWNQDFTNMDMQF